MDPENGRELERERGRARRSAYRRILAEWGEERAALRDERRDGRADGWTDWGETGWGRARTGMGGWRILGQPVGRLETQERKRDWAGARQERTKAGSLHRCWALSVWRASKEKRVERRRKQGKGEGEGGEMTEIRRRRGSVCQSSRRDREVGWMGLCK